MPPLGLRRRFSAAGVALLCLAAQIGSLAHLVLVPHESCPEHGEAVHAGTHTPAADRAATGARDILAVQADDGPGEDDEHHHCLFVTERRKATTAVDVVQATAVLTDAAGAEPAAVADSVGRAVYRLAPKTSPPA